MQPTLRSQRDRSMVTVCDANNRVCLLWQSSQTAFASIHPWSHRHNARAGASLGHARGAQLSPFTSLCITFHHQCILR